MSDTGDGLGPDGSVYLHRYLSQADSLWFSAGCRCGASRPIGVRAAIAAAGCGREIGVDDRGTRRAEKIATHTAIHSV